jgi:hypothetical protein
MRGLIPLILVATGGCFAGGSDVDRAARDGSSFVRQAFVEHRYDDAARANRVDATNLRDVVAALERDLGSVVEAQAMSSAPALDSGALFVWYRVRAERGSGNVGLLIRGDGRGGYRVERVHADSKPAPGRWPGRLFARAG